MNLQETMQNLRDLAEGSADDIIANAAANLASRLESVNAPFGYDPRRLSRLDLELIRFARKKKVDSGL